MLDEEKVLYELYKLKEEKVDFLFYIMYVVFYNVLYRYNMLILCIKTQLLYPVHLFVNRKINFKLILYTKQ